MEVDMTIVFTLTYDKKPHHSHYSKARENLSKCHYHNMCKLIIYLLRIMENRCN